MRLLLLLLLLLAAAATAQPINLVNGPGSACIGVAPSPPSRLQAKPGDGSVQLTWDRPANGACVQEYDVRK